VRGSSRIDQAESRRRPRVRWCVPSTTASGMGVPNTIPGVARRQGCQACRRVSFARYGRSGEPLLFHAPSVVFPSPHGRFVKSRNRSQWTRSCEGVTTCRSGRPTSAVTSAEVCTKHHRERDGCTKHHPWGCMPARLPSMQEVFVCPLGAKWALHFRSMHPRFWSPRPHRQFVLCSRCVRTTLEVGSSTINS